MVSNSFLPAQSTPCFAINDYGHAWSDHAAVSIHALVDVELVPVDDSIPLFDALPPLPPPTALDHMVVQAIGSARTQDEENVAYFGPVMSATAPTVIYVASSCTNAGKSTAKAGCAVYWGKDSTNNISSAVPGVQSDARAALYAIALAIMMAPKHKTLVINSGSQHAVRSYCYWASGNATRGWGCKDADIIRSGAEHLRARLGAVTVRWISGGSEDTNKHLQAAKQMARIAARADPPLPVPVIPPSPAAPVMAPSTVSLPGPKVFSPLPAVNPEKKSDIDVHVSDVGPDEESHRGRERERQQKRANLESLQKKRAAQVTAGQLHDVFKERLNPPDVLPEHFDVEQHQWNAFMAGEIPDSTQDRTPGKIFSRPFTIEDVEKIKARIKKHDAKSATGVDRTTYLKILEIPNDVLVKRQFKRHALITATHPVDG
ncbi:hypothetical protein C8R43DRAFT_1027708 [Mycena crocata]|nr:hypothetical protein C8R43DRAFT_1027708 [Mycena crocata]